MNRYWSLYSLCNFAPTNLISKDSNNIDLTKTELSPIFQKWFCIKCNSFPISSFFRLPLILLVYSR